MITESLDVQKVKQLWITQTSDSQQRVGIPTHLASTLGVKDGDSLLLAAGSARTRVPVHLTDNNNLGLNSKVLEHLGLATGHPIQLQMVDGRLRLGPVVGVLAPRRAGLSKPYQAQTALFKRLIAAAKELGIVLYIFDFHDIQWSKKRVRGYTFNGSSWHSHLYPLPDAVFDRATGTFHGGSAAADVIRRRLSREHGIPIFNTKIGNKMRLYKLMHADSVLRAHLPPTYRVTGSGVVAGILAHHRGAYLKPQNGTQGKGIIRIRRANVGVHYVLTTDSYQRVQGTASTTAAALAHLRSRVSLSGYLVQPEINLIRLNGRICDVRVLVQRDADGEWHVTGIGVRAGQAGSVVSNLHGGGKALRLEGVLQKTLGADSAQIERIRTEVEEISLRVGRVLAHATKCLGELGVDIGIDTQGRVWIIEANSRTGRATFRRAGIHESAQLADRRPLLFAQYLAGFSS